MGKGLAFSAKHRYWGLEKVYKYACEIGEINTKEPMLIENPNWFYTSYKMNGSQESAIRNPRWVLLLATKIDWRDDSEIEYIQDGMDWIERNWKPSGMQSIAVPALGCGLGGLEWDKVYPVIQSTLEKIDIPSEIYIPWEEK